MYLISNTGAIRGIIVRPGFDILLGPSVRAGGHQGMILVNRRVCGSPYTAAVDEKMNRLTLLHSSHCKRLVVTATLLWWYFIGSWTDSATSMKTAKCMTASMVWVRKHGSLNRRQQYHLG